MTSLRRIQSGKHLISIAKLNWDGKAFVHGYPDQTVCGKSPYDIQYRYDKQLRMDIYSAVARWIFEIGASSVGGPILSGAILAEGIAARSKNLQSFYVAKRRGLYRTSKHVNAKIKGICSGNYVIIDDIVGTGETLETTLKFMEEDLDGLIAILILSGEVGVSVKKFPRLAKLIRQGKVFCLYYSRIVKRRRRR